jgi:hypothetical protein
VLTWYENVWRWRLVVLQTSVLYMQGSCMRYQVSTLSAFTLVCACDLLALTPDGRMWACCAPGRCNCCPLLYKHNVVTCRAVPAYTACNGCRHCRTWREPKCSLQTPSSSWQTSPRKMRASKTCRTAWPALQWGSTACSCSGHRPGMGLIR